MAILGGFSAAAVYRMMSQLIEAAETLVRGDVKRIMELREQAIEARMMHEATRERLQIVNSLMHLKQQLMSGAARDGIASRLDQIVAALVPVDLDDVAEEANQPPVPATMNPVVLPAVPIQGDNCR